MIFFVFAITSLLHNCCNGQLLSVYGPTNPPFVNVSAWSRQLPPIYTGLNAVQIRDGVRSSEGRKLPQFLLQYAESQGRKLLKLLAKHGVEVPSQFQLEMWPGYDDDTGAVTWVWARWRLSEDDPLWRWIPSSSSSSSSSSSRQQMTGLIETSPIFPYVLKPWSAADAVKIFDYPQQQSDLYAQPYFGNCIWGVEDGSEIFAAWLPPENFAVLNKTRDYVMHYNQGAPPKQRLVCRSLPVPSYFNGIWETYVVNATTTTTTVALNGHMTLKLSFPGVVSFVASPTSESSVCGAPQKPLTEFPSTFDANWLQEIVALTRFTHKSAGDSRNHLGDIRAYLRQRYEALGMTVFEIDASSYMGIRDANLVAVIRGSDSSLRRSPVVLCDHYDTAFAEDIFAANGTRVSTPGADDNGSASATLLQAASGNLLLSTKPARDVWLVHLTGEEYPADDLGARALDAFLLEGQYSPKAVVVLDMISWRANKTDTLFQVNAGDSLASLGVASCALGSSMVVNTSVPLKGVLRTRFDPLSYLYNTDGVVFATTGWPTVLINEHINLQQNFDRPYYHQSSDTVNNLDASYGASLARIAIETVAQLAQS